MPAKHRDLFDGIASFAALIVAAGRAAKGKRSSPAVAAFLANLEPEALRLERQLRSGTYRPGRYKKIEIFDPKHRIVSAAPFRDRVVHHAFCAVCEPIFERGFIHDSYANRVAKGTHRAVARYERFRDRARYVLRCDIYRYFPSIDHQVLKADLRRRIACERTLALADRIIDGSNPQEPVYRLFAGDDLLTPLERRPGAPHRQPDQPVLRERVSRWFRPLLQGGAARQGIPALRGRLRPVSRRPPATRGVAGAHRGVSRRPTLGAASAEDGDSAHLDARPLPRLRAAPRWPGGGSPRRTSGVFATACGACATAGTRAPCRRRRCEPASALGSPTPNTRTPGACANRSFAPSASGRRGGLALPRARLARRLLEQQSGEPPRGEPQQEYHRQPQQQQRVPRGPHARMPEPTVSRHRRAQRRASREDHDENETSAPLAPLSGGGAASSSRARMRARLRIPIPERRGGRLRSRSRRLPANRRGDLGVGADNGA